MFNIEKLSKSDAVVLTPDGLLTEQADLEYLVRMLDNEISELTGQSARILLDLGRVSGSALDLQPLLDKIRLVNELNASRVHLVNVCHAVMQKFSPAGFSQSDKQIFFTRTDSAMDAFPRELRVEARLAQDYPDVLVFRCNGRITARDGRVTLRACIQRLSDRQRRQNKPPNLIMDLAGLSHIDTAGLDEIVKSIAALRAAKGGLRLIHVDQKLHMLLIGTRAISEADCFNDEASAAASFQ